MSKEKILIVAPVHPILIEALMIAGYELYWDESIDQTTAIKLIADCVGLITSTRLMVNQELIDAAPNLRFVGRMGSGMEVIDLEYAATKGIRCFGSPEGNCNAVAEHALGMLLALNKNIVRSHQQIEEGQWLREENRGTELEGKTIGIIGFGNTGRAFAKLLRGIDMKVLVYDKYQKIEEEPHIVVCDTLDAIFEQAEIVSFHVPFAEDTFHLMNDAFVEKMRKPFVLINTSRGTVVDCEKIPVWLAGNKLKAAAIDVWEEEPLEKMSKDYRKILEDLAQNPNVIFTPHIAGYSYEALYKMSKILLERITQ